MGMEGLNYLLQEDKGYEAESSSGEHSPDEASSFDFENDPFLQEKLLQQAQALLFKSQAYQKIGAALQKVRFYQPNFHNLTSDCDEDFIGALHRDAAVNNLRFLNIFYGFSPKSFALAVNFLDRLLGKVKAHPKYLSCITISCFYIAMKTQEEDVFIPRAKELVTISQCGCSVADLLRMEGHVLEKLDWQLQSVTPFTFLTLFLEALAGHGQCFAKSNLFSSAVAKLDVLMCHYQFNKYRAETISLALLSHILEEMNLISNTDIFSTLMELQYYCQIDDRDILSCRGLIQDHLVLYYSQPTKLPRLQLVWTISRRTLNKLKPSQRVESDLETIDEDESDTSECDYESQFDSENENEQLGKQMVSSNISDVQTAEINMKSEIDDTLTYSEEECVESEYDCSANYNDAFLKDQVMPPIGVFNKRDHDTVPRAASRCHSRQFHPFSTHKM